MPEDSVENKSEPKLSELPKIKHHKCMTIKCFHNASYLVTIPGMGYKFTNDVGIYFTTASFLLCGNCVEGITKQSMLDGKPYKVLKIDELKTSEDTFRLW
jgi:hypothetical protein